VAGKSIDHHSDQPIHHFSPASTAFRARRSVPVAGALAVAVAGTLEWLLEIVDGPRFRDKWRCRVCRVKKGPERGFGVKPCRQTIDSAGGTRLLRIPKRKNLQQGIAGGFRRSS
jgi:hypothetical protein